jgi:uncharacterized protein (DUF1330 family)
MAAFLVVDTKIENPEAYEEYKAKARPIIEKFGGRYRARGGALEIVESDLWRPTRLVLIEFPNREQARKAIESDEYRAVAPLRHSNAKSTLVILEGI